ncbi:MAG TPA: tetratricopeptide repeat protein [Verrucomicrobiae bacterium]|nr:tetratricopeptide repeat protein [Verrucomicrobiae bacterium]
MEYFLTAILATVGLVLSHLWRPRETVRTQRRVRNWIVSIAIGLVWLLSIWQWLDARRARKDTEFIQRRLAEASISLSKVTTIAESSQKELSQFRRQSDKDQVATIDSIMGAVASSRDQSEYAAGCFALTTGRREEAKNHFRRAIALNPKYSKAHNNLAILLREDGDEESAFRHLRLAFESDTNNAVAAVGYAGMLMQRGRMNESVKVLSAPNDLVELDSEAALGEAKNLSGIGSTNFFRYLAHYVQYSISPSTKEIAEPLRNGWRLVSAEDRASLTNWLKCFQTSTELASFESLIVQLGITNSLPAPQID